MEKIEVETDKAYVEADSVVEMLRDFVQDLKSIRRINEDKYVEEDLDDLISVVVTVMERMSNVENEMKFKIKSGTIVN